MSGIFSSFWLLCDDHSAGGGWTNFARCLLLQMNRIEIFEKSAYVADL